MPDPSSIVDAVTGHWRAKALFVALEAGLFEILARSEASRSEVCDELGWPERSCHALVDACVALGWLSEEGGVLGLTVASSNFLVADRPSYLGGWALEEERTFADWCHLHACLRDGRPARPTDAHGYFVAPPAFHRFLHGVSTRVAEELCRHLDLSCTHLVELGAGSGAFGLTVARHCPSTRVSLVDRAEVCAASAEHWSRGGAGSRVRAWPADFFEDPLPSDADVVLLANVLHDWSEEDIVILLTRAIECLGPRGQLIVVEVAPPADRGSDPISSMLSLSYCLSLAGGFSYGASTYRKLLDRVGVATERELWLPQTGKLVLVGSPARRELS